LQVPVLTTNKEERQRERGKDREREEKIERRADRREKSSGWIDITLSTKTRHIVLGIININASFN